MKQLIEWDRLEIRVDGARLNELMASLRTDPVERMELRFSNGRLQIAGSVRKFVSIPFLVEVTELLATGTTVRAVVASASAFGAIPIPRFLFALAKDRLPAGLVAFEEPATFVVSLDRFLPEFVSADIQKIWIVDGGLAVTVGRGGADLPAPSPGGSNEQQ